MLRRTPRGRKRSLEKFLSLSRKANPNQVRAYPSYQFTLFAPYPYPANPFVPFFPAPTKKRRSTNSEAASRIFQNVISLLHDQICQLRNGSIFHGPVKISDAPDYYDIVRRPIDLKAIKARIRDGQITNSLEYQRDIYLMFANSMMYNRPDSDLYKMAEEVFSNIPFGYSRSRSPPSR